MHQHKTKGAIIRSKARWYNEGEKQQMLSKFRKKRHGQNNAIRQIKTDNEETVTSDKDILTECKTFILNYMNPKEK